MTQPLRPTLREKRRYIVYEPADDTAVEEAYVTLFGIYGCAQAGILRVQKQGKRSILRVSHTTVDQMKAALAWSGRRSLLTTGTLKQAKSMLTNQKE